MGPSTLAACADDSRSDDMLKFLAAVSNYHFDNENNLVLDLMLDGGNMIFAPSDVTLPVVPQQQATPAAKNTGKTAANPQDSGPRAHARGKYRPPHYTVARGDTLFSIAKRFGITAEDLLAANNLPDNHIQRGTVLVIPGATSTKKGHPPTASHYERVRFGDTVGKTLNRAIVNNEPRGFIVHGKKGQVLEINTVSPAENLNVKVLNNRGRKLRLKGTNNQTENNLFVRLPYRGDYIVIVSPTTAPENQKLPFQITFVVQ
jgi:LysM repeat protein